MSCFAALSPVVNDPGGATCVKGCKQTCSGRLRIGSHRPFLGIQSIYFVSENQAKLDIHNPIARCEQASFDVRVRTRWRHEVQCVPSINIEYLLGMPGAKTVVKISVVFKLFETILLIGILLVLSVTLLLACIDITHVIYTKIMAPPAFIVDAQGLMELFSLILILLIGLELIETVKTYLEKGAALGECLPCQSCRSARQHGYYSAIPESARRVEISRETGNRQHQGYVYGCVIFGGNHALVLA